MKSLLFLLAAQLIVAGCLGATDQPATPASTGATGGLDEAAGDAARKAANATEGAGDAGAGARAPLVQVWEGSVAGFLLENVGYVSTSESGRHVFEFEVKEGATAIVAEAAWQASDALDVLVFAAAYCQPGDPAGVGLWEECPRDGDTDGKSPAILVITDKELLSLVGRWEFGVWARQSPQEVPFKASVSVFYGGQPGGSYSAIPA